MIAVVAAAAGGSLRALELAVAAEVAVGDGFAVVVVALVSRWSSWRRRRRGGHRTAGCRVGFGGGGRGSADVERARISHPDHSRPFPGVSVSRWFLGGAGR